MVRIVVKDYLDHCYTNQDGEIIYGLVIDEIQKGNTVAVSFEGMDSVSSSFVNSAFIELLDNFDFGFIKEKLTFIDSSKNINDIIKRRFSFETSEKKSLIH